MWTGNIVCSPGTGRIGFLLDEGLRLKAPTFRLLCDWFEGKDRYAAPAPWRNNSEALGSI